MKRLRVVALAAMFGLVTSCASARSTTQPIHYQPVSQEQQRAALDADGRFGADLLATFAHGNVVISPYSISTALEMALVGARGETAIQMAKVLHHAGMTEEEITAMAAQLRNELATFAASKDAKVEIANGIWPQRGFPIRSAYVQAVREAFGATEKNLDFARHSGDAARTINTSVSKATHGKIPKLFSYLDPATVLVLTNAVYLKAKWVLPFDEAMTAPGTFHRSDGSISSPQMMEVRGHLRYAHRDGYQIAELPYRGGRLAMWIILPDGHVDGLETQLGQHGIAGLTTGLRTTDLSVNLPRFTLRTNVDNLIPQLMQLGMRNPFGNAADFSGIDGSRDLAIDQVAHKAFISVSEEGTEAAAATGVAIAAAGLAPAPITLRVDHPFVFAITDTRTGAPLFLGRVADPTAG